MTVIDRTTRRRAKASAPSSRCKEPAEGALETCSPDVNCLTPLAQTGARIRAAREGAYLSHRDIAKACRWFGQQYTTATSLARIEAGEQPVSSVELVVISGLTGVDMVVLKGLR